MNTLHFIRNNSHHCSQCNYFHHTVPHHRLRLVKYSKNIVNKKCLWYWNKNVMSHDPSIWLSNWGLQMSFKTHSHIAVGYFKRTIHIHIYILFVSGVNPGYERSPFFTGQMPSSHTTHSVKVLLMEKRYHQKQLLLKSLQRMYWWGEYMYIRSMPTFRSFCQHILTSLIINV